MELSRATDMDDTAVTREGFPLTASQRDIWLDQMSRGDSPLYNIGGYVELNGTIVPQLVQRAVECLVAKHDALRTVLRAGADGLPVQSFAPTLAVSVPLYSVATQADPLAAARRLMQQQIQQPYELEGGPLFRFFLVRLDDTHNLLGTQAHHLILDGWGFGQMLASLGGIYSALARGEEPDLVAPSYIDFIADDQQYRDSSRYIRDRDYWLAKYRTLPDPMLLPRYRGRWASDSVVQAFPTSLHERMKALASTCQASAFHVLLAAVHLCFAGTSQRNDWVLGVPILNRGNARFKSTLGLFTQVSALRFDFADGLSFGELVCGVRDVLRQDLRHQRYPLSEMNRALGLLREDRSQLFEISVSYEQDDHDYRYGEAQAHTVKVSNRHESTPLTLHLRSNRYNDKAWIHLVYNEAYFEPAEVQALAERLTFVLEQGLGNTGLALREFVLVTPAETERLAAWNATAAAYDLEQPIQALFEAQVRRTPEAVAVVAGERSLTYRQLNERANQLAHCLREQGVQPDARVAICVERGLELVIGLWAIVKAGGAYVPLDPGYPPERLEHMLRDSSSVLLLVHAATRHLPGAVTIPVLDFDHDTWHDQPVSEVQVPGLTASNLAYVIYTSGSTGTPKGVALEHRGLCNLVHWSSKLFTGDRSGALLQKSPFSFDGSVWEFFWPLTVGMRLVLARPDGQWESAYLAQTVREQQVTVIKFVPAMLQQFLELEEVSQCTSLTDVFCGGGELTAALAHRVRERLPGVRLHNVYGPTEATVDSTVWTLEPGAAIPDIQLPIGRPICNTRLYVLDAQDRPVPIGFSGQLHIGGVGVARGYLGLPQLVAERFIDSPFVAGDRLYRTGDLVRYRADGNLEFLGRDDFQVKLRGFRLELGEIEARLSAHDRVREAVVLMRDERLVAYFTPRDPAQVPAIEALRNHLSTLLPDYMVPSAYVRLDAWPLTPNGKLDRQALPAPGIEAVISRRYEAPQGAVEIALAQIWAEVLKIERVGRNDHFFELGGHSLLAMKLVARMREAGLEADASAIFSEPRLAALATRTVGRVQALEIPATTIPTLNRRRRL
ncbi:non-ribosomal peptide synthetase [Pseudomonas gingeri]